MNASEVRVASVTDLKDGELLQVRVNGKFIALARTDVGIIAIADMCTHAHCFLSSGWLEDGAVICPCHGAEFDARTGVPRNTMATQPLQVFGVRVDGEDVYVVS